MLDNFTSEDETVSTFEALTNATTPKFWSFYLLLETWPYIYLIHSWRTSSHNNFVDVALIDHIKE